MKRKAAVKTYRVIVRRSVHSPDHWGVQILDGYTDGRPSWRLATPQRFWMKLAAQDWILKQQPASR